MVARVRKVESIFIRYISLQYHQYVQILCLVVTMVDSVLSQALSAFMKVKTNIHEHLYTPVYKVHKWFYPLENKRSKEPSYCNPENAKYKECQKIPIRNRRIHIVVVVERHLLPLII